jgi:hypothetical protein
MYDKAGRHAENRHSRKSDSAARNDWSANSIRTAAMFGTLIDGRKM